MKDIDKVEHLSADAHYKERLKQAKANPEECFFDDDLQDFEANLKMIELVDNFIQHMWDKNKTGANTASQEDLNLLAILIGIFEARKDIIYPALHQAFYIFECYCRELLAEAEPNRIYLHDIQAVWTELSLPFVELFNQKLKERRKAEGETQ